MYVCLQRRFNTLSLLDYYLGPGKLVTQDIAWNPNDPNVLNMALPGAHFFPFFRCHGRIKVPVIHVQCKKLYP